VVTAFDIFDRHPVRTIYLLRPDVVAPLGLRASSRRRCSYCGPQSTATLLTLMLLNSPVEAEFRIASRDIGFVQPGDRCTLKIDAFNFTEHGTASGSVRWISDGAFTADDNGQTVGAC
jgi:hypothetical protein